MLRPRIDGQEARERPGIGSFLGSFFCGGFMPSRILRVCSRVAEIGLFVGAAAALAAGVLGLR